MNSMRNELSQQKTYWDVEYKDGKRRLVKTKTARAMGRRINFRTGATEDVKLQNFIQFKTYASKGTTVIGGMFKRGKTEIRRDGRVVDTTMLDGVGKATIGILNKLETGVQDKTNNEYTPMWKDEDGNLTPKSMATLEGTWKATRFATKGRRNAEGRVNGYMTSGLVEALRNRERDVSDIKARRVS